MKKTILLITMAILIVLAIPNVLAALPTTTTKLWKANETNTGDTYVYDGGSNQGDNRRLAIQKTGGPEYRIYMKFNITDIPGNYVNITNATLFLTIYNIEEASKVGLYKVYTNGTNSSWDEYAVAWGNQSCGVNFNRAEKCNFTSFSNATPSAVDGYIQWDMTFFIRDALIHNEHNISFALRKFDGASQTYVSKENATEKYMPFINITYSLPNLNINFTNEITESSMSGTEVDFTIVGDNFAANYSTTTGTLSVTNFTSGDYRLTYDSDTYGQRDYYINLDEDIETSLNLYILPDTNGTDVTFKTQDTSGNELENATIYLKRYYSSSNSYKTVAMSRTNFEGESIIDVDFNDAYYQVLTSYKGVSLQTIGARIISTTMYLTLNLLTDPFTTVDTMDNIDASMTFNNLTETFSYTFVDSSGTSQDALLEVYRITPTENILECSSSTSSASATLLCPVNTTNHTGTYTASGYILTNNMKLLAALKSVSTGISKQLKDVWGNQRTFFAVLVTGTLATLGFYISPALGVVLFLVGLGAINLMGLSMIGLAIYGFIILAGIIIVIKVRT